MKLQNSLFFGSSHCSKPFILSSISVKPKDVCSVGKVGKKLLLTPSVKLLQLNGKTSESLEGWVFAHLEEEGGQNGQNNKQPEFRRKQLRSEGRLEPRTQDIRQRYDSVVKPVDLNSAPRSHRAEEEPSTQRQAEPGSGILNIIVKQEQWGIQLYQDTQSRAGSVLWS